MLETLENSYLEKRNDIYFVFKFISPYIPKFYEIKANHGISMFMMSKKAYVDMKSFSRSIEKKENIFKIPHFFEDFVDSPAYSNLKKQVNSDLELM